MSIKLDLDFLVNGADTQTNFTTQLLRLIFKADQFNKEKLRRGFPREVEAVEHYQATGDVIEPGEVEEPC